VLDQARRRQIVREQLELISLEYNNQEAERIAFWQSSVGMVSRYEANVGGRSGKTPDPCAVAAYMDISDSTTIKKARTWRGLTSRVYGRLLTEGQETTAKLFHNRLLAWLLFQHVLLGKPFGEIAKQEIYADGHLPLPTIYRYYSEIVDLIVVEAVKYGLIP
jgi:hypothetical protein